MVLNFIKQYFMNTLLSLKIKNCLMKKNNYYSFSNKKGQATVEMILLLSLFLLFSATISTVLKDSEVAKTIIGKPWKVVSGMIESGTWQENPGTDIHPLHPAVDPAVDSAVDSVKRRLSVEGE